jgi:corrinoid protein of di/trimethylamine methyltransferase
MRGDMTHPIPSVEENLWKELADAVVQMDEGQVRLLAEKVLREGFSPEQAILNGLTAGMRQVGEMFSQKIYFVPEVLVCADTMYAGFNILKQYIPQESSLKETAIIIGVVEGDFHDIGKNIVALMLQTNGFTVYDLGKNVTSRQFIQKIQEIHPRIVALSTLMSTTLDEMRNIVQNIKIECKQSPLKIMVGGAPVSRHFADEIGADFYGEDAHQAVLGAQQLCSC